MPEAEQPGFCTSKCAGLLMTDTCGDCGHAAALHVGVDHCPVCELVQHNRQVRAAMAANRVRVEVAGLDPRTLERAVETVMRRDQFRGLGSRFRR